MDPTTTPEFRSLRMRQGDQPLPKKNKKKYVKDMIAEIVATANLHTTIKKQIIKDIESRNKLGLKRYGTYLQPFNGRDFLKDLKEELLDAYQYAVQGRMEKELDDEFSLLTSIDRAILDVLNCIYRELNGRKNKARRIRTHHLKLTRDAVTGRYGKGKK